MSDLVKRLRSIADASRRDDGTDIPLGEYLRQAASRIEQLEAALQEAITRMTEAARDAGHWKGKYEAAGYPGTLDGWIEKAKALEAENARLLSALLQAERYMEDCPGMRDTPAHEAVIAALAGRGGSHE